MSFILEAIQRSEEARHKRRIPRVSTIHAAPPVPARAGSRTAQAALAMVLALALGVAAVWLLAPRAPDLLQPEPAPSPAAVAPAVVEAVDAEPSAVGDAAAATKPTPMPTEPAPAPAPAEPMLAEPQAVSGKLGATPPAGGPASGDPAGEAKPRRPYQTSASREGGKPRRDLRPSTPAPAGMPDAAGSRAEGETKAPPPKASELVAATALRDLPPAAQRTLPSIAITLHRYAASADARMIRVNGRVAREGDAIGPDLRVAEITRNGVVFTIAGQRFYMDAFQTWQAKTGS